MKTQKQILDILQAACAKEREALKTATDDSAADRLNVLTDVLAEIAGTEDEPLYYLEVETSRSAWKKWQKETFAVARLYFQRIFKQSDIDKFADELNKTALSYKNAEKVTGPDWESFKRYHVDPYITIGYGCQLTFRLILGEYPR